MNILRVVGVVVLTLGMGACASTQNAAPVEPVGADESGRWVANRSFAIRKSPKAAAEVVQEVRNGTAFDAQVRAWDEIWHQIWMTDGVFGYVFGRPFQASQAVPPGRFER